MPPAEYEILVVNNAPEEDLSASLARARSQAASSPACSVRLIPCAAPGLSAARNAGLAEARGRIVAFLDDDAEAEPGWLEALAAAFDRHPEAGVIGGPILLRDPESPPFWYEQAAKPFLSHLNPPLAGYAEARHWGEFPWGANWAARRRCLLEIGGFRMRFGRGASGVASGEDVAAAALIQRAGYRIGFEPAARVRHLVEPDRFRLREIRRAVFEHRRAVYELEKCGYIPMETAFRASAAKGLALLAQGIFLIRQTSFQRFERLMRGGAELAAAVRFLGDYLRRLSLDPNKYTK